VRLTRVEIQAYRSLYNVTLIPDSFTVLVGPNNAGKTNLADSLEFLGQVARNGLEVAVSREGGFENLAFRRARRTRKPVRFAFEATMDGAEAARPLGTASGLKLRGSDVQGFQITIAYSFELRASSESRDADFRVTSEDLHMRLTRSDEKAAVHVRRRDSTSRSR